MFNRRRLFMGGALFSALGLYSYQRGLRYPPISFEHRAVTPGLRSSETDLDLYDLIVVKDGGLRAIAPEPSIVIKRVAGSPSITVLNIAPNAVLTLDEKITALLDEEIDGITRTVHLQEGLQGSTLKWILPVSEGFEFAVMGDTGGGSELAWTLKRAHDLGAQFLLHLGDFNYSEGEYDLAIDHFNNAELPCYISIGNHEYHSSGLIYDKFLSQIGPMNHAFELAGKRFINLDTSVDFWPAHAGNRGRFLSSLLGAGQYDGEQIIFTHRPLKDPQPHDDHEIGGIGEVDWLSAQFQDLGVSTLLSGHVHHSAELDYRGLRQMTIGEGLGHEDLVLQKHVSKMMMATVELGKNLEHRWVGLNMPWSEYQNPKHLKQLKFDRRHRQIEWFEQLQNGNKQT